MSDTLNAATFPLWGSRLIEASAGTGKTWTIAALYLRLVLGHGGDSGFTRPLLPSEILVMTFTRAATRELSDRIRSRLLAAARCFRAEAEPDADDGLLTALLAAYPPGPTRSAAAWRLAMAAENMDEAAVHTIDAWCQRMLREHAFDSGCAFDEALNANERAMQVEAAQDFWRQQLYPLEGSALDVALGVWRGVAALADDARALLNLGLPDDAGQGSLGELIARLSAQRGAALGTLKVGWPARARAMQAWLDAQMAAKACGFNKSKLHARYYMPWLVRLAAWADDPAADALDISPAGASRLTPAGMEDALNGKHRVDLPDHFSAFEQLMQALDELPPLAARLRAFAAARIAQRLSELKRQAGTFGFADLLTRLDDALNPALNPLNADRLRSRMLAQHPVALIDEFQDTSPVQSRIFDRLYRMADNARDSALLLIGDPKQAIYGFRGADIHSYLTARRATAGRHYVLGTNHRSTQALVAALNHLFGQSEERAGEGAFMFRMRVPSTADSALTNPLPFIAVAARGRAETFVTSIGTEPALTFALDPELIDANTSRRRFAARCAERITALLNDDRAGFDEPLRGFTRLRPADIAVLVRTGREALAVRRELRRRGVASVYLSDQLSVFASREARDLLHWLRAVAAPLDMRLARAALATRTLGLSIAELAALAADDEAFDARTEQLRQLHAVWRGQGVLTMLRQTLHRFDLPARWLGAPPRGEGADTPSAGGDGAGGGDADGDGNGNGERSLTNILHIAELLQAASAQLDGEQALIRWMAAQMAGDTAGADEQIVRLESDADLVKVVTVHKAKGLEYPLVFLPFGCGFRAVEKARTRFVSLADEAGARTLHLQPSAAQIIAADGDRQREDLRLLYVALTRARHAVWVGVAALKVGRSAACSFHRSALGYVLGGARALPADALAGQIEAAVDSCRDIVLTPAEAPGLRSVLKARGAPIALREPTPYAASFERRWSIGSFSALVRALPVTSLWSTSVAAVRDDEAAGAGDSATQGVAGAGVVANAAASAAASPWHRFPRGAVPGNFLHDQLEWLAGEGFDLNASDERRAQLLRRCDRQGWGARGADLLAWLAHVVATPLPPFGAALAELRRPLPEMEFWFPSAGLAAGAIDTLCRAHLLAGRDRPALPERELRGMLMGFADLVFEHGGRYWVLDYKSNHLGASDADYTADALEAAMAQHRYDVQAALYLLALHRLLGSRLGAGYDPARHLGGAVYLFLRGIRGPAGGCYHVMPPLALLSDLDALLGAAEGAT